MVLYVERGGSQPLAHPVLRGMFAARKSVFVDLLGWTVPVIDDRFEVDQFDTPDASYLVVTTSSGAHLASARLLRTTGPHILGDLYPVLCDGKVPRSIHTLEITRFCLDRRQSTRERCDARNRLISAIAEYGLAHNVHRYTGVAELGWLQQILAFGWRCRPLGMPREIEGRLLGALAIDIDPSTPALLAAAGIYLPAGLIAEVRHAA